MTGVDDVAAPGATHKSLTQLYFGVVRFDFGVTAERFKA
jgi:hypothetical protein